MSRKTKTTATKEETTQALVPKLRFPEFREAAEWASEQLSEVYSFKSTNSLSRDQLNYIAGSVKNIHYGDIHTKFSTHFDVRRERVPFINASEESTVSEGSLCVEGDMIFADASEDVADIGKSIEIVCLSGERVASGQHTILATRTSNRVVIGFGGHVFAAGYVRAQIQKEAQGTKVLGISASRLRNIYLPLPHDQFEQARIADCLSSLDELLAAQARKVEALKAHKKGLMEQLFPREGETQPRLRFPEFRDAGEWITMPLGNAATFYNGRAYKQEELLESGKYTVLRVGNFFTNNSWYHSDLELDETKYCDTGDLLYAWSASFGPRIWGGAKVIYHYHIWKVVEHRDILRRFLFIVLENETEQMKANSANGLGLLHITKGTIEAWQASFPPPAEQARIADCLSSLDDLIAAEAHTHEALKTHKKGLMQQLFPTPAED